MDIRTDKETVAFHPAVAYGIATVIGMAIACMGFQNRQSGWRRVRSNTLLDVLLLWAAARQEARQDAEPAAGYAPASAPAPAPAMSMQIASLAAALSVDAGMSPVEPKSAPASDAARPTSISAEYTPHLRS